MNFFITSASLLNEATISHLSRCGYNAIFSELINSIIFEGLVVNTYENRDDIEHIHIWDGAVSICSTPSKDLITNASIEAEAILTEYTKFNLNRDSDHLPYSLQHSCVLYDVEMNQLHITSDSIGSIPIWYSIQQDDLMVSTDYLGLYYSGHMYPNALGPGQKLTIDLKSNEIISISHSLSESAMVNNENSIDYIEVSEVYARNIFVKSIQAIDNAINNDQTWKQSNNTSNNDILFTMELDPMEPSSILLDCIADSMKFNRAIRRTRPLVVDDIYTDQSSILTNILNTIPDSFIHAPVSSAREVSFKRIAIDRWNLCYAASNVPLKRLISFDIGLVARSIHIYFQNLFCYLLDVTISYPFYSNELQKAIWSNIYPKSYLYDAVAIIQTDTAASSAMCHSIDSFEDQGSIKTWTMNDLIPCSSQETYCIDQKFHYVQQPYDNNMNYYQNYFTNENISIIYTNSTISSAYSQMNTHIHAINMNEVYINKESNSFLDLWYIARKFINKDGIIILLLATSGYKDLLNNFLCSIKSIDIKNILIITQDENIKAIANDFEVGSYSPLLTINSLENSDFGTITYQQLVLSRTECALELLLMGIHPIIADIDTVWTSNPLHHIPWSNNNTYYLKTNPTTTASKKNVREDLQMYDIAIVDDSGEVCGCFVALHYQENTIKFWRQVVILHRELVFNSIKNPNQYKFDDSEQKILTDLIYKSKYEGGILKVITLPSIYFPSGFVYFSAHSFNALKLSLKTTAASSEITNDNITNIDISTNNNTIIPAIIHNNFIIGRELKQTRFQRYGLWNINNEVHHSNDSKQINICIIDKKNHIYNNWEKIFLDVQQDVYMPSISIHSPIHNSILVSQTNELMLFISLEGPLYKENISKRLNISENYKLDFIATQLQVSTDPPKYIVSSPFLITKYNLSNSDTTTNTNNNNSTTITSNRMNTIRSFTLITKDPKISISVDVSLDNRQHFGIDRKNLYYTKAMEHVLYNQRLYKEQQLYNLEHVDSNSTEVTYDGIHHHHHSIDSLKKSKKVPYLDIPTSTITSINNRNQIEKEIQEIQNIKELDHIIYKIIVITYNRSNSLYRLLQSLSNADYMNHTNIDLYIYIDGFKSILEKELVLNCKLIADTFLWEYGLKHVSLRDSNIGLVGQWYHAWSPQNESEVAFIFEDDIEVSPYYFIWAYKAIEKYYQYDHNQRYLHQQLLDSIHQEVSMNGTKQEYIDIKDQIETILYQSPLERFTYLTAGKPIIYGVCLQKQSLDPHHYPRKLQIKNGFRPYLYSLIGSWGPLMLPNIWNAFKIWWEWKYKLSQSNSNNNKQGWFDINTEDIVTNYFYSNNKNIWTPWHIRFTYETATKCLYSNLPDDYAIVISHREQGENYIQSIGPDHRLIIKNELKNILEQTTSNSSTSNNKSSGNTSNRTLLNKEVYSLLSYQPSMEILLSWSFHTLPDISFLSLWQYDFNLRRIGSVFSDAAFIVPFQSLKKLNVTNNSNTTTNNINNNTNEFPELELKYHEVDLTISSSSLSLKHDNDVNANNQMIRLNRQHWITILEIIQSNILPYSRILHLGLIINPIFYLSSIHDYYHHYVYYSRIVNNSIEEYVNNNTNPIEHISDFQSLQDHRFSIILINLQYLIKSINYNEVNNNISEFIWNNILPVEYILVFDVCSNAPTDFSIEFKQTNTLSNNSNNNNNNNTNSNISKVNKVSYSIVEDICHIGNEIYDKGAVLYSISKGRNTVSHSHQRVALSRRIESNLQSRRVLDGSSIL